MTSPPRSRRHPSRRPDDFSSAIRNAVARRAGYLCSYPGCRIPTIGPRSDADDRAMITGEASHICAASPGGPRFDPTQTPADRRSIANAIWLCKLHARAIDVDVARYPVTALRDWKRMHEQNVSAAQLGAVELTGRRRRSAGGPVYDDLLASLPLVRTGWHDSSPRALGLRYARPSRAERAQLAEAFERGYWVTTTSPRTGTLPPIDDLGPRLDLAYDDMCWRLGTFIIDIHTRGVLVIDLRPMCRAIPHHLAAFTQDYLANRLGCASMGSSVIDEGTHMLEYEFEATDVDSVRAALPLVISWLRDHAGASRRP